MLEEVLSIDGKLSCGECEVPFFETEDVVVYGSYSLVVLHPECEDDYLRGNDKVEGRMRKERMVVFMRK